MPCQGHVGAIVEIGVSGEESVGACDKRMISMCQPHDHVTWFASRRDVHTNIGSGSRKIYLKKRNLSASIRRHHTLVLMAWLAAGH